MSAPGFSGSFLEQIVGVNFGGGPFALLYVNNSGFGQQSGTNGTVTVPLSPVNIQGTDADIRTGTVPFSFSQPVIPGGSFSINNAPDGSGTAILKTNDWRRVGSGGQDQVVSSDVVAANIFKAWLGQIFTDGQFSQGVAGGGGGICFYNVNGYVVIELSKFKTNISFKIVAAAQPKTITVALATWKDNLRNTVGSTIGTTADQVQVTGSKGWVDQFPDYSLPGPYGPPHHAVDYAYNGSAGGGQATSLIAKIDIKTLKVSLTPG